VVIGVVLAWVYHRTGRLSAAWLAHALNNLLALVATLLLA
jgi:membrane protease YdiL (CAAX protease family)